MEVNDQISDRGSFVCLSNVSNCFREITFEERNFPNGLEKISSENFPN